jgi:hypothetical protein
MVVSVRIFRRISFGREMRSIFDDELSRSIFVIVCVGEFED